MSICTSFGSHNQPEQIMQLKHKPYSQPYTILPGNMNSAIIHYFTKIFYTLEFFPLRHMWKKRKLRAFPHITFAWRLFTLKAIGTCSLLTLCVPVISNWASKTWAVSLSERQRLCIVIMIVGYERIEKLNNYSSGLY